MTDKNWAQSSLIDPFKAPDPSDETGLNSHFTSTFAANPTAKPTVDPKREGSARVTEHSTGSSTNPFRRSADSPKEVASVHVYPDSKGYPTPPYSADSRREQFPTYRDEAFGENIPKRRSQDGRSSLDGTRTSHEAAREPGRRRGSSLYERYPGDMSNKPLATIKQDTKAANRSPHLKKKHIPGPDSVDKLDLIIGGAYHHEGPFDAALLARNNSFGISPVAALQSTNKEALKATPKENIRDSIERHRPLDGTATTPPGQQDKFGRTYNYHEGTDMMRENGADYKRWPGIVYQSDDLEGQGEPAYSLSKALKDHRLDDSRDGESQAIELDERPRKSVDRRDPVEIAGGQQSYVELESEMHRKDSTSRGPLDGLKKRIGSLRHRKDKD